MPLEIQIKKNQEDSHRGTATVELTGSLDTATAPELESQLTTLLVGDVTDLVFDLARLNFITSAGLRIFANARKRLKERGGQASFIHLQPQIQEVFEIIKALPGVAVFPSIAELDAYLANRQQRHTKA